MLLARTTLPPLCTRGLSPLLKAFQPEEKKKGQELGMCVFNGRMFFMSGGRTFLSLSFPRPRMVAVQGIAGMPVKESTLTHTQKKEASKRVSFSFSPF